MIPLSIYTWYLDSENMGFLSTWEKKYIVATNQKIFKFETWEKIRISNCKAERIQLSPFWLLTIDYFPNIKKYPVAHEKLDIRVQID